jgi:hypothetical protein
MKGLFVLGRLAVRAHGFGVRQIRKHGAHHDGTGFARQFEDIVQALWENHEDQPQAIDQDEVWEEAKADECERWMNWSETAARTGDPYGSPVRFESYLISGGRSSAHLC